MSTRNIIFGGIGVLMGGGILLNAILEGKQPEAAPDNAYAQGRDAGQFLGILLFVVGLITLLREFAGESPKEKRAPSKFEQAWRFVLYGVYAVSGIFVVLIFAWLALDAYEGPRSRNGSNRPVAAGDRRTGEKKIMGEKDTRTQEQKDNMAKALERVRTQQEESAERVRWTKLRVEEAARQREETAATHAEEMRKKDEATKEAALKKKADKASADAKTDDFSSYSGDTKTIYEALRKRHQNGRTIPRDAVEAAFKDADPKVRARALMYLHSFMLDSRNHADVTSLRTNAFFLQEDDAPEVRGWSMLCNRIYYAVVGSNTFDRIGKKSLGSDATFEGGTAEGGKVVFSPMKEKAVALSLVLKGYENAKKLKEKVSALAESDLDPEIKESARKALEVMDKPVPMKK